MAVSACIIPEARIPPLDGLDMEPIFSAVKFGITSPGDAAIAELMNVITSTPAKKAVRSFTICVCFRIFYFFIG